MIAGLEEISGGLLKIDDVVVNDMAPKNRNISFVFQNYALYPHMTVRDNILFGLDVKKVSKDEQNKRLMETAEVIGLTELLDRKPGQLSGGQRQRVALARSICSQAAICLMDEPLSNLDAKLRAHMRTEIRRIHDKFKLTTIYVTHDQVEAMTMGDKIMVLNGGRIQQVGSPLDLYNTPANKFVASFIGSPQMNMADAVTMGDKIMVLNGGRIQQVGSPLDLYNTPANKFVASFIGSPQMNMADAVVKDDSIVINNEISIAIDESLKGKLSNGQKYSIGIRPENLTKAEFSSEISHAVVVDGIELLGNETQVLFKVGGKTLIASIGIRPENLTKAEFSSEISHAVVVDGIELLGNETQVLFKVGGKTLIARWPGQWRLNVGEIVFIEFNTDNIHFFNIETEALINGQANGD